MLIRYCDSCEGTIGTNDSIYLLKVMRFTPEDREKGKEAMPQREVCGKCFIAYKGMLESLRNIMKERHDAPSEETKAKDKRR